MPIQIIRSDITKVRADAIVNSTNSSLECGGLGVDASIHAAAGPELAEALQKIGSCELGSAVLTEAYGIRSCKYIIHAAPPPYEDGKSGEEALLRRCYRRIFALAREKDCCTIAMPILSSGAYGYPKAEAYRIAAEESRAYLEWHEETEIRLVLFGRELTEIARAVEESVQEFITDDYGRRNEEDLIAYYTAPRSSQSRNRPLQRRATFNEHAALAPKAKVEEVPMACLREADFDPDTGEVQCGISFGEAVDRLLEEKNMSVAEFYRRSNITRSVMSRMRKKDSSPMKYTALACAVALRLDLEETDELLQYAGFCLSPSSRTDVILSYYIRNHFYDIDAINLVLFEKGLHCLGSKS